MQLTTARHTMGLALPGVVVLTAALIGLLMCGEAARGQVTTVIATELRNEGLTVTSISLETPPPTTTRLVDQTLTFDQYKPYLSPNPAAPLPIARVSLSLPAGGPLSGILTTPGFEKPAVTTLGPTRTLWRLAAMSAVKRAIGRGTQLAGLQLDMEEPGQTQPDRTLFAAPNDTVFPARLTPPSQMMSVADVRREVQGALPVWAQQASVSVQDDAAAERIVTVSMTLPISAFSTLNVSSLRDSLAAAQAQLLERGADIGRTIVKLNDTNGDPLYLAADQRGWGIRSTWKSPLIAALVDLGQSAHRAVPPGTLGQAGQPPRLP